MESVTEYKWVLQKKLETKVLPLWSQVWFCLPQHCNPYNNGLKSLTLELYKHRGTRHKEIALFTWHGGIDQEAFTF